MIWYIRHVHMHHGRFRKNCFSYSVVIIIIIIVIIIIMIIIIIIIIIVIIMIIIIIMIFIIISTIITSSLTCPTPPQPFHCVTSSICATLQGRLACLTPPRPFQCDPSSRVTSEQLIKIPSDGPPLVSDWIIGILLKAYYDLTKMGSFNPLYNLVGGFNPSEKYKWNWIISPSRDENRKYLKPPPRNPTSRGFDPCSSNKKIAPQKMAPNLGKSSSQTWQGIFYWKIFLKVKIDGTNTKR